MVSQRGSSSKKSMSTRKKSSPDAHQKPLTDSRSTGVTEERTVKRLRLSKALTVPDTTNIFEACCRMAARRVDALLLTGSNALLCGILTDKDIAKRVIAQEVNLEETPVSKVMTRNPLFVLSDTLAVEALQKMVEGKFRHLPVVENGEVIALLDISKCLYDAIARMERAAEKGDAIAAAVEGVEKNWSSVSGPSFLDTLRERFFKPSLSTIINENSKIVTVLPTDTVLATTRKMVESRASFAIVTVNKKPRGILTSKDILMRLIAKRLPANSTSVEKVMTPNPDCATIDTPIVDALHKMQNGNFLHLPVVNRDGVAVAVVDVLRITQAAVTTVGSATGISAESANTMLQNFWDSVMASTPDDEDETPSENSQKLTSEGGDTGGSATYSSSVVPSTFPFKIQDSSGRIHRFTCNTRSLTDLSTTLLRRVGNDIDRNEIPQIMYEDEDKDKVVLTSDSDLVEAVDHAKAVGWKVLRLYLDNTATDGRRRALGPGLVEYVHSDSFALLACGAVAAGAAVVMGLGILAFLRRSDN